MASPLKDDFAARSRLEARLLARRRAPSTVPVLPRPDDGELRFAASPAQEGMWDRLATARRQPLIVGGLRLTGPLDTGALLAAWDQVAVRHETLRSAYRIEAGALTQVVAARPTPDFGIRAARPGEAQSFHDAEQARQFDPGQGPLARLRVLREGADDHLVMVCLHHLIADARGLECVTAELSAHYLAAVTGTPPQLPELPVQYADFVAWHRARIGGELGRRTVAYWAKRLAGAVPALLPTDLAARGTGPADGYEDGDIAGRTVSFDLPGEVFAQVREVAVRHRTTLYVVGLTAFQILLARWSGQQDICVRAPVSYRDRGELHHLVADFSNDVVVRADFTTARTLADAVEQVRTTSAADLAQHEVPPHLLAAGLSDPTLLDRLFQVQFTAESEIHVPPAASGTDGGGPLGPLRARPFSPTATTVARPLGVRLRHDDRSARCIIAYRSGLFSPERVLRLRDDYFALLGELAAQPQGQVLPGAAARC